MLNNGLSMTAKTLIITGATGGMGKVCASLSASQFSKLVLLDLDQTKLEQLAENLAPSFEDIVLQTLDITDDDSLVCAATLLNQHPADAVIHTAGISPTMADWQKIVEVDLIGAVKFMNLCQSRLRAGACFVMISSMSAYLCSPNPKVSTLLLDPLRNDLIDAIAALEGDPLNPPGLAYSYSKKALQDIIKRSAVQWGRDARKRLVSVSPGFIATDMGASETQALPDFEQRLAATAFNAMGAPEDIAEAALFLTSDKARYITGTDLLVDGGFIATVTTQSR